MRGGWARTTATTGGAPRGFTLFEAVVVIVLLAVLTGVIVPRLASPSARRASVEVDRVVQLLSSAASREQLTMQRVGINAAGDDRGDREFHTVLSVVRYTPDARLTGGGAWSADPLLPTAGLEVLSIVSVTSDGASLDPSRFRVEFRAAEPRPELVIVLEDPASEPRRRWTIVLSPGATRARVVEGSAGQGDTDTLDLDRGAGGTPWS